MNSKSVFTEDELLNIKLAPIRVFNLVADADGKIDKKEIHSLEILFSKSSRFDSEIAKDVFADLPSIGVLQEQRDLTSLKDREALRYVSAFLDRKVDREPAIDFKKVLLAMGLYIANASGGFFQEKIHHDEESALNSIAKDLDLSYRDLLNSNQLSIILEKLFA